MERIIAIAIALLSGAAHAQSLPTAPPYPYPVTVGTSSVQAIGSNPSRKRLIFINPNATAKIACSPAVRRDTSVALPAIVNGAGSFTLLPYNSFTIDGGIASGPPLAMSSAWNCIADTVSSALTILEFE